MIDTHCHLADKRFDKAANALSTLLSESEPAKPAFDDGQGTLDLPPIVSKKSA